eukprot:768528-Hanusia_phi.AAC.4
MYRMVTDLSLGRFMMGSKLSNQPHGQYDCSLCNIRVEPGSKNPMKCGLKSKASGDSESEQKFCCQCTNAGLNTKASVVECVQCKNKYNMPLRALGKKANDMLKSIHDKIYEENGDREGKEALLSMIKNALEGTAQDTTPEKSKKSIKQKFLENVKSTTVLSPGSLSLQSPEDPRKGSPGLSVGKSKEKTGRRKFSRSPTKSASSMQKRLSSESSKEKRGQTLSSDKKNEFAIDDQDDSDRDADSKNHTANDLEIASTLRGKRLSMKMEDSDRPDSGRRGKRPKVGKSPDKILSWIGTKVRKGFLVKNKMQEFTGTVISYDAAEKLYMIEYEDGDSEEFTPKELQRYKI